MIACFSLVWEEIIRSKIWVCIVWVTSCKENIWLTIVWPYFWRQHLARVCIVVYEISKYLFGPCLGSKKGSFAGPWSQPNYSYACFVVGVVVVVGL